MKTFEESLHKNFDALAGRMRGWDSVRRRLSPGIGDPLDAPYAAPPAPPPAHPRRWLPAAAAGLAAVAIVAAGIVGAQLLRGPDGLVPLPSGSPGAAGPVSSGQPATVTGTSGAAGHTGDSPLTTSAPPLTTTTRRSSDDGSPAGWNIRVDPSYDLSFDSVRLDGNILRLTVFNHTADDITYGLAYTLYHEKDGGRAACAYNPDSPGWMEIGCILGANGSNELDFDLTHFQGLVKGETYTVEHAMYAQTGSAGNTIRVSYTFVY